MDPERIVFTTFFEERFHVAAKGVRSNPGLVLVPVPQALNRKPYKLNPRRYTLHPTPYTLDPTP